MRISQLAILPCLALAACATADATPSSPVVAETRTVSAFHGVSVSAIMDIEVTVGSPARVEVKGPKDWLPKLVTSVDHGVLEFSIPGHHHNMPRMSATIVTPELSEISVSGITDLHAAKIAGKSLAVSVSGLGKVGLEGSVGTLDVSSSGQVELDAKALVAKTAAIQLSGAGSVTVNATKSVAASISGAGDITIYGKPQAVSKNVSGVGNITLR